MKKIFVKILTFALLFAVSFTMAVPAEAAKVNKATAKQAALAELGILKNVSGNKLNLDKPISRSDALVMIIQIMGKESEALKGSWKHPFTDVESWADKYVGYAYKNGLITTDASKKFETGNADITMYLDVMLRALNYKDSDFVDNSPNLLAKAIGLLPDNVDTKNFKYADAVLISWAALETEFKTGDLKLSEKLISDKIITTKAYAKAVKTAQEKTIKASTVSSEKALKEALSDKTVKSVVIDSIGNPVVLTGEASISSGVTLTVNKGSDFYIEGTLTNNGIINVMGADSVTDDFINYSVMTVQKNGKVTNNGIINLLSATLSDDKDYGPIGGQLRINGGSFINKSALMLKRGSVNTHGGMAVVISGIFTNYKLVVIDGFFLRIENGKFTNRNGAVIINNTTIFTQSKDKFVNNGVLNGADAITE